MFKSVHPNSKVLSMPAVLTVEVDISLYGRVIFSFLRVISACVWVTHGTGRRVGWHCFLGQGLVGGRVPVSHSD